MSANWNTIVKYASTSTGKRKRRADEAAVNEITKKLEECNINVSDISLEVRSFISYLTIQIYKVFS